MTGRVDFYLLNSAAAEQRWNFACRLTEKAYLQNLRILILSDSLPAAKAIDELLWTFSDRSFVPHRLTLDAGAPAQPGGAADAADAATPVQVALDPRAFPAADLLVNLTPGLPAGVERFARVVEIIDADEECKRLGRERFKGYRDLGLCMETHQVDHG